MDLGKARGDHAARPCSYLSSAALRDKSIQTTNTLYNREEMHQVALIPHGATQSGRLNKDDCGRYNITFRVGSVHMGIAKSIPTVY